MTTRIERPTRGYAGAAIALLLAVAGCRSKDYMIGRDTVQAFGDGRFQICKVHDQLSLWDEDLPEPVMYDVVDWAVDGDWVHVSNRRGEYVVLNYETRELNKYASLDDVPPVHKDRCAKLKTR